MGDTENLALADIGQKFVIANTVAINLDELPQPQLTGHQWRQQGTALVCQSCPFTHGSHLEPGYQLYGIDDDGTPMLRKIIIKN